MGQMIFQYAMLAGVVGFPAYKVLGWGVDKLRNRSVSSERDMLLNVYDAFEVIRSWAAMMGNQEMLECVTKLRSIILERQEITAADPTAASSPSKGVSSDATK